jgi:hypothetical protein
MSVADVFLKADRWNNDRLHVVHPEHTDLRGASHEEKGIV